MTKPKPMKRKKKTSQNLETTQSPRDYLENYRQFPKTIDSFARTRFSERGFMPVLRRRLTRKALAK